jgi:HK97 gp10 family phage protein
MSVEKRFDRSQAVVAAFGAALRAGLEKSALDIGILAEQLVPVDTGRLKATITPEVNEATLTASVTAGDSLDPNYGVFQEYGTVHQSPQPFMTPAAQQGEQIFADNLAEAMRKVG